MKSPRLGIENFSWTMTFYLVQEDSLSFPQTSLDRLTNISKSQVIFHIHLIFGPACKEEYIYNSAMCYHYLFFYLREFLMKNQSLEAKCSKI